jgi:hypothetical protein
MSYTDLVYSGQLWSAERMVAERDEDDPELAERRYALVFLKNLIFKFKI